MQKQDNQTVNIENSDIGLLKFCLSILYERENDELAWRLIKRFGGVNGIFGATHEELIKIDGVTDRVATFFSVLRPLNRQAQLRAVKGLTLDCEQAIADYAAVFFMNEYEPIDVCVTLDKKGKIIRTERLCAEQRVWEVAAVACKRNAHGIVLLRYEPRLSAKGVLPTPERQRLLIKIAKLMGTFGIEFVDYMEYSGCCYFSLRRASVGNIEIRHVYEADTNKLGKWKTIVGDLESYYSRSIAHKIEEKLKQ